METTSNLQNSYFSLVRKRFLKKDPNELNFEREMKSSGLTFKTLVYAIDQPDSWTKQVKLVRPLAGNNEFDATNFVKFQYSSYDINELTSMDELSYCFAVRDAIIGEKTPLDWENKTDGLLLIQAFH